VRLLLTENESEAQDLVARISDLNRDRKALQKTNIARFLELAEKQCDLEKDRLIFVVAEGVEHGVTGIVASQMAREFSRPTVLLISDGAGAAGSSRSIPGFNIVAALKQCEDLLVKYGGHPAAAGLSVVPGKIDLLKDRLKGIASREIPPETISPRLEIDAEIDFGSVTSGLLREISALEPFGQGNPPPVFSMRGVELSSHSLVGAQKNHIKLVVKENGKSLEAMGWGMSSIARDLERGQKLDIAFQLEANRWKDSETLQLLLVDLCEASSPLAETLRGAPGKGRVQLDLDLWRDNR
jgi:single-stranded-DNA-specific exonuclease